MYKVISFFTPATLWGGIIIFSFLLGSGTQNVYGQPDSIHIKSTKSIQIEREAEKIINDLLTSGKKKKIQQKWHNGVKISTGIGYKDNVLLSPLEDQNSPFVHTGLSGHAYSPESGKITGNFFFLGESKHYFSLEDDHEYTVYGQGSLKYAFMPSWNFGFCANYAYYQQFYDLAQYGYERAVGIVKQHRYGISPFVEKSFPAHWTAKLALGVYTARYDQPIEDYDTIKLQGGLTKKYAGGSKIYLSYTFAQNDYHDKEQKTPQNLAISGTHLDTAEHTLQLKWKYSPDKKSPWQFQTRFKATLKEDNGENFYDYTKYIAEQSIKYRQHNWTVEAKVKLTCYDYHERDTMGYNDYSERGTNPTLVNEFETVDRTRYNTTLHIEKHLTPAWSLYLETEYINNQSNEIVSIDNSTYDYDSSMISMGLVWRYFPSK